MTYIYNPQQLESSENTFVTALAFAISSGQLTATRNDGVELTANLDGRYVTENTHTTSATFNSANGVLTLNQTDPVGTVTVDLDGRFPTENTHLDSATLSVDNVLSLGMVNPTSTITVDLSELSDLNTHLDSASFSSSTKKLLLNMVNPSSQIEVDLSGIEGDNTFVTSASFTDGTLTLSRNDSVDVTVDLDGRYATQNTHLDDVNFNTTTRELTLDMVNPTSEFKVTIPGGPDENTFLESLAFNKDSGGLIATLNNATTVETDLDGRYITENENTHLASATYNTDSSVLRLSMVNPASNIDVTIETSDQQNTHLDSATFDYTDELKLNMVNPSSTISVDLSEMVVDKYLPLAVRHIFSGDMNTLLKSGIYQVASTAVNIPVGIEGYEHYVAVYSSLVDDEEDPTSCVQIWHQAINQNDGLNPNTRMWMRIYSKNSTPIVSRWQEINNGGGNGYLRGPFTSTNRDLNHEKYRITGSYYIPNINYSTPAWSNGPSNFPDSSFNVLHTTNLTNNQLDLSLGNGCQELVTADYHVPSRHVRVFRRNFEASSSVENYSEWYEVFHQGVPIELEVNSIYQVPDQRSSIDVTNVRVIQLTHSGTYYITALTNGVQGQVVTLIKTNNSGVVYLNYTPSQNGNIMPPSGPDGVVSLNHNRSISLIYVSGLWYSYGTVQN